MYAVIETGGKQYTVKEGDVLEVELLAADTKAITNVLAIAGTDSPQFGAPFVEGASVDIEILGDTKAKKVIVFKMKRRKSYRRKQGHRQQYTVIRVAAIKA